MKGKRYRIQRYGWLGHIFDVEVKTWYGWVVVKRYRADITIRDLVERLLEIDRMKREAESLMEKLEEKFD